MSRNYRLEQRPWGRWLLLLLVVAAAVLCPAAAVRALASSHRPAPPTHLVPTAVTRTSVTIAWHRSTGPGRIARYRVLQDGRRVGRTTTPRYSVSHLRCGTAYT